ncbi:MAG: GIY-YIG nuclease family protein [Cycloclasticus sp.]
MQPATIKLFLTDGKPEGIRTAEISNWTGKAIAGPRSELSELLKREELVSPGVYFLTGVDPETDKPSLYIGEAESVTKRLKQHRDRDDWSQVTAFVSKDENLTKAHIRYLEGSLIKLANSANNALLQNNVSSGAKLPESDKAEMDVYLEKMLQLLPILGIDVFKVIDTNTGQKEGILTCSIKGLIATGKRTANGFVVLKGSQAVKEHRASSVRTAARREQYAEEGLLMDSGNCYVFSKDYEFSSPSAAGAIVRGGRTNGLTSWKNEDGIVLKDLD